MNKDKIKKAAIKVGLDALGIVICSISAVALPDFVPTLKGMEVPLAVSAGIWLYIPLREGINKIVKWKR